MHQARAGTAGTESRGEDHIIAVVVFSMLILYFIFTGLLASKPRGTQLLDFGSFVASGRAAAAGLNPYGVYPLTPVFRWGNISGPAVNLNPPVSVVVFQALARFDPSKAFRVWYGVSFGLYLAALALLVRAYPQYGGKMRVAWALSLWGFWNALLLGQIYVLMALAAVGAWLLLRRQRPLLAGVLIGGLIAVKPNFAVWPLLLLVGGYWSVALVSFATVGLLSVVPVLIYGPGIYAQWLAVLVTNAWIAYPPNGSLFGLAARLGLPALGTIFSVALLAALVVWVWRTRPGLAGISSLALVASLLASPIAWVGYTLVLLPIFFSRAWTYPSTIAAVLWMVPESVIVANYGASPWRFVLFGFLYNLALLLVLASLLREARTERASQPAAAQGDVGALATARG